MPLLNLPPEVFTQIVGALVESEGKYRIRNVVDYRLVCRKSALIVPILELTCIDAFSKFVTASLIDCAAKLDIAEPTYGFLDDDYYLHRHFSTDTLCKKVLLGIDKHPLVANVSLLVGNLVEREWPLSNEASEQLRERYARNVCDAIRALGYDRFCSLASRQEVSDATDTADSQAAGSAAVGNVQMLLNNISTIEDILTARANPLPNPLEAAVAANQAEMVEVMLRWVLATVKGPWETGTWDEMRSVGRGLVEALRVAVRISHDAIGKMILQALTKDWSLAGSVHRRLVKQLYEDCVRYGNSKIFMTARYWKRHGQLPDSSIDPDLFDKLTKDKFLYVVRRGRPSLLRYIVKTGLVNANLIEDETPLWLILKSRRYRMAKALLQAGADIDGLAPGQTRTAYWRSYEERHGNDQYFLIDEGADTRRMSEHGTPRDSNKEYMKPHIRTECHFHEFYSWERYF
jgi:hypothetical protein